MAMVRTITWGLKVKVMILTSWCDDEFADRRELTWLKRRCNVGGNSVCLNRKFQCDGIVCQRYKSSDIENAMHRKGVQYIASYVKDINLVAIQGIVKWPTFGNRIEIQWYCNGIKFQWNLMKFNTMQNKPNAKGNQCNTIQLKLKGKSLEMNGCCH